MGEFGEAFGAALTLLWSADSELIEILAVSLTVSLAAVCIATMLALPVAGALALSRFTGRRLLIILFNACMGLPPVVVGLVVYLLLSRSGPFGSFGLLYTVPAMIIAQTILITPLIVALARQVLEDLWVEYEEQLRSLGAGRIRAATTLLWEAKYSLLVVVLAGFGRAIAEVGAVLIVGGNIAHYTRTMTTAIALETSKGDLALALGLGIVLIVVALGINASVHVPGNWWNAVQFEAIAMSGEAESLNRPSILPLTLKGVSYAVSGRVLLSDINLTLAAGGNTVVLGFNGAGKSLLLRLCHGLLTASAGRVQWAAGTPREAMRQQAMVFQRPLMLRRSVAENVEYALQLRGLPSMQRRVLVQQALAATGLESLAGRNARVLSGGEQQRVALARAWVLQPQVLFLDEPTANLDPGATRSVEEIVRTFRRAGVKVVMTTHDVGQARRLADEIIFLHAGRVIEQGAAAPFFQSPASAEAQAFVHGELV